MHLADGSVHHRSILTIYIHRLTIDDPISGDTAVGRGFIRFHIEICSPCGYKCADLNETVVVEQSSYSLARFRSSTHAFSPPFII